MSPHHSSPSQVLPPKSTRLIEVQYDRLCEMRAQLERLVLTHRWTLRETDLYNFQVSLQEIDHMRVDGKFVDAEGNKAEGQTVRFLDGATYAKHGFRPVCICSGGVVRDACLAPLQLKRKPDGLIYRLMASSEPISEELMPIANVRGLTRPETSGLFPPQKLSTIKRCCTCGCPTSSSLIFACPVTEISRFGGPYSPRDLYPYALALNQIDSLRKDGKFMARDGSVPEGQAIVTSNLAECYEMLQVRLCFPSMRPLTPR
jgi:hypothetical protein